MWTFLASIAGPSWRSLQLPLYGLLLLVLLVSGLGVGLFITTAIREWRWLKVMEKRPLTLAPKMKIKVPIMGVMETGKKGAKVLGVLLVGMYLGWTLHVRVVESYYVKEYAAWKARSVDYQRQYAMWLERQPKHNKEKSE